MVNKIKYDRSQEEWDSYLEDPQRKATAFTWFESDTVDHWRHDRMRAFLRPIIDCDPAASWLTVGDGRFGTDGNALMKLGALNVHCSDISDTLLKIGCQQGFIKSYSAQNAENIKFGDGSFNYVYCKEAFHHFPRPYIALYEMFRVANKAVVLTEPRDYIVDRGWAHPLLYLLRKILFKNTNNHSFEQVGNYIYTLSIREMEKFLLGMHYNLIAFYEINDAYQAGVEFIKLDSGKFQDKLIFLKLKMLIFLQNCLSMMGIRKSGVLTVILFKIKPTAVTMGKMKACGWSFKELPSNPYL
jgi:ubiquinone/menaquinone biosynthesis C-methylase UbiE